MPRRPCIVCGTLTLGASHCPAHTPVKRPSPSSRATARPGWNALRARALLRDGHACTQCGHTAGLAVHHVVSVAQGGTNTLDNTITLCATCHHGAHGPAAA
jgi:5-methylcytosine-specific restriction endonuclease McrA